MQITKQTNGYHINWHNEYIPLHVFKKIVFWIKKYHDYSVLDDKKIQKLDAFMIHLNKKYGTRLTTDQYIHIRNIVLKQKIVTHYHTILDKVNVITEKYHQGADILALSREYDYPPYRLLRLILLRGENPDIKQIFLKKANLELLHNERDMEQFYKAESHDLTSYANQKNITKNAAENEQKFVQFFKDQHINLLTEHDLVDTQTKEHGRAISTPDLVFQDEVYINGVRIYWIDYKDYVGTNIKFIYSQNVLQAEKYTKIWGPGAVCYHGSMVENLVIPDTMLLDGTYFR